MNPSEKYWGILQSITQAGITLRCLNLSSFDDWLQAVVKQEEPSLGLATIFFPLSRVERMFLDEPMGGAESLGQLFERRVGMKVETFLGLLDGDYGTEN